MNAHASAPDATQAVFDLIADERRALADLTESLTDAQLATPSLVPTWTVRDVLAHLTTFEVSTARFIWAFLASGFNLDKTIDRLTFAQSRRRTVQEIVHILRVHAEHRFTPPNTGPEAPFTDLIVHGLDLRRPLQIVRAIPENHARICLDFLTAAPAIGHTREEWRKGLRYEASDIAWSFGEGPLVRGGSDALMLGLCGRPAALTELEGDGVEILRRRFGVPS